MNTAAYFDLDGTLTPKVTLFEFLRFEASLNGKLAKGEAFLAELARMRGAGHSRRDTNKRYFKWWRGRAVAEVTELAEWWWANTPSADRWIPEVLDWWRHHAMEGHRMVIVSASFGAAIAPLADELRANAVYSTKPEVVEGRYTGRVAQTMLGPDKADAVEADATRCGIRLENSFGYGDHESDYPFLSRLGHPRLVVPNGPRVRNLANIRLTPS